MEFALVQKKKVFWSTFSDRKVLALQSINNTITVLSIKRVGGNIWAFIEQRPALILRDWEDRLYCVKVIELLLKLNLSFLLKYMPSYMISND